MTSEHTYDKFQYSVPTLVSPRFYIKLQYVDNINNRISTQRQTCPGKKEEKIELFITYQQSTVERRRSRNKIKR